MKVLNKINLSELSERDSLAVSAGTGLLAIVLLYFIFSYFLFTPLNKESTAYQRNASKLKELEKIKIEYEKENKRFSKFQSRLPKSGSDLNAIIVNIAKRAGLDKKIENLKSVAKKNDNFKEITFKFTVTGINTKELVDFLYQIKNNPKFMHITEMEIVPQTADESSFLDVQFKTITYTEGE